MRKKEYSCPEITLIHFLIHDVILGSPEYLSTQINTGGWDSPTIDDDDEEEII